MLQCCVGKKQEIRRVVTRFLDLGFLGLAFKYLFSNAIGLELWRRICQNIAQTRPLSVPFYMRQHLLLSIKLSLISDFHSIQSPQFNSLLILHSLLSLYSFTSFTSASSGRLWSSFTLYLRILTLTIKLARLAQTQVYVNL